MVSQPIFKQNYFPAITLISAWLLGNIETYHWFIESLKYSVLNLILLVLGSLALLVSAIRNDFWQAKPTPRFRLYPVLLMLGGEIGAIISKWTLDIPQLTLLCFILGSYGILGLFMRPLAWHKGLSVATMTACVVPFLVAFNSGLGFPVRVITAHAVAQALSDFHLSAVSSYDIIVMENGIAEVDLPCSGMKSLWTGTVFLLGATWIEHRQLGFRWLLVAIANLGFLITANIVRVLILVVTLEVFGQRQIADLLHLPLGIVGFIFASILTWVLLQTVPLHTARLPEIAPEPVGDRPSNLNWLLSVVIILGIVGQFNPAQTSTTALASIELPPEITTEQLALSPAEANFFNNPANPLVQKLRFTSGTVSGSMLLVASNTWQAHHPPELCFVGNGLKVDRMDSRQIDDEINARWLSLQNGTLSATYWFQSSQGTTDDFIWRIWDRISHRGRTWVMVSILFDDVENHDSRSIKTFSNAIYQTINHKLNS